MLRLAITYILLSGVSATILWVSENKLAFMFEDSISLMIPLATLCGALSFAFYNFVDSIIKDLPKKSDLTPKQENQRAIVVESLTDLKGEVIINVIAVICLLMINYLFVKLSAHIESTTLSYAPQLRMIFLTCSGAALTTSFLICAVQLRGFLTANQLRKVLSNES